MIFFRGQTFFQRSVISAAENAVLLLPGGVAFDCYVKSAMKDNQFTRNIHAITFGSRCNLLDQSLSIAKIVSISRKLHHFPSTWRSRGYQKLVATDLPEPTDNPNHKESGRIIVSGTVVKEPINTEPILITMIYHEI